MLIIPSGIFPAMHAAQDAARDLTLAQLDIIAAASGGAMHAATGRRAGKKVRVRSILLRSSKQTERPERSPSDRAYPVVVP